MTKKLAGPIAAALALALLATPAMGQQYSDSYSFLKAVKERDGATVEAMVAKPGSVVINDKELRSGDTALHIVARDRDLLWLRFLLGQGAKPNVENEAGQTPLSLAAQIGWLDGVRALLAGPALVDFPNSRGETALIIAVQRRDRAMVEYLLERGADPRKTDQVAGFSALDYARRDPRSAAILRMLEEERGSGRPIMGPSL